MAHPVSDTIKARFFLFKGIVIMTMQNVLKQLIKETIAPLFNEEGYKKKNNNFAKTCADFSVTVNIQSSKSNTKDEVEFFFNTGIFMDSIFENFYYYLKPQFPLEIHSILRIRSTNLTNSDSWYKLTEATDLKQLRLTIIEDITKCIFPHFRQFQSIEDVIKEMELREKQGIYENPHYLTILYHSIGKKEQAQERMIKVFQDLKLEVQKEYTKELAKRLGL
jgi:hypothetical protein